MRCKDTKLTVTTSKLQGKLSALFSLDQLVCSHLFSKLRTIHWQSPGSSWLRGFPCSCVFPCSCSLTDSVLGFPSSLYSLCLPWSWQCSHLQLRWLCLPDILNTALQTKQFWKLNLLLHPNAKSSVYNCSGLPRSSGGLTGLDPMWGRLSGEVLRTEEA